jgi:hypothetical protein
MVVAGMGVGGKLEGTEYTGSLLYSAQLFCEPKSDLRIAYLKVK